MKNLSEILNELSVAGRFDAKEIPPIALNPECVGIKFVVDPIEGEEYGDLDPVIVTPSWIAQNGTPVDDLGGDMKFDSVAYYPNGVE